LIYFCFTAEMPMDLCMKKWFQPEFWSDPKLSIHAIHLKNEETTSTFATYWILMNHAYNQDKERAKKYRKKKKIFFKKNPTHMFDLNTYQEILLFLLCHAWNCYDDRYFLFICFMISSFKKYCPNSLCVVCPKRRKKNLNSGCFNKNC
jgi:hypothetical protein